MPDVAIELLEPGQWAEVIRIAGDQATVARLGEIGLHAGARFRVLHGGVPSLLELHGARISLRLDGNFTILVRPIAAGGAMTTLDLLDVGQRASITAVAGADSLTQRLMEMGLFEGEEIEVLGVAPLGDPLEIGLRDYRLSLRRSEAACVRVTLL